MNSEKVIAFRKAERKDVALILEFIRAHRGRARMRTPRMVVPRLEPSERRLLSLPWRGADEGLDRLSHHWRNTEGTCE